MPYDRGDLVARVHRDGEIVEERHEETGTRLVARVEPGLAALLEGFGRPSAADGDHGQVTVPVP